MRRCPICLQTFPETDEYFYRRPSSTRYEYCLSETANGCHDKYWARVRARKALAKATPPSDRQFGVEIEVGETRSRREIETALHTAGLAAAVYSSFPREEWTIKTDHCGIEITTPILSGQPGRDELRAAMTALSKIGVQSQWNCGLHVHHNVSDLRVEQFKRVVLVWCMNQVAINKLVANSRVGNGFCRPVGPVFYDRVDQLLQTLDEPISLRRLGRYNALNVASYERYGTIEIRQHQGTIDYKKISAWVDLTQSMVELAASDSDVPSNTTVAELLDSLRKHGLSDSQAEYLADRADSLDRRERRKWRF